MLGKAEIVERFWEYYHKCLRDRKEEYLSISSVNCKSNGRHRVKNEGQVGFCHNPEVVSRSKKFIFVCNDDETAKTCKCYECKNTEKSVEENFAEIVKNPSQCGQQYPKLAVLIWVLQGEGSEITTRWQRFKKAISYLLSLEWW